MIGGYTDFEFDLPEALLERLVRVLDSMRPVSLLPHNITNIPEAQGVYQLFWDGDLVYIGKTDAEAGLNKRLGRHASKIQHRHNLDPELVSFKAVRIYVFTAVDLETQLIGHYQSYTTPTWNNSGFGANDPGRNRDGTRYKSNHFDLLFPIDIDRPLSWNGSMIGSAAILLSELKYQLPYVFRYEGAGRRSRQPHPELDATQVSLSSSSPVTARSIIEAVISALPSGWQATQLPSHLILYRENTSYPQGSIIARS